MKFSKAVKPSDQIWFSFLKPSRATNNTILHLYVEILNIYDV